jgi:hypothetical protein
MAKSVSLTANPVHAHVHDNPAVLKAGYTTILDGSAHPHLPHNVWYADTHLKKHASGATQGEGSQIGVLQRNNTT